LTCRHHIVREIEFPAGIQFGRSRWRGWISGGTRRSLSESEDMQKETKR
jgi:hypothetical protein